MGFIRNLAKLDERTRPALIRNGLKRVLLEHFPEPAPAVAQLIAERCAIKLTRVASFESYVLAGKETPAPNAERNYLSLTASIRAVTSQLSKGTPAPEPPTETDLQTYIKLKEQETKKNVAKALRVGDTVGDN